MMDEKMPFVSLSLSLAHHFPPCIVLSVTQVVEVVFVAVGFPLKRDAVVGVALLRQFDQPFHHVPHIKGQDTHFEHLCRVDALMIDEPRCQTDVAAAKQDPQDIDGGKPG